jgi:hypothetical protein
VREKAFANFLDSNFNQLTVLSKIQGFHLFLNFFRIGVVMSMIKSSSPDAKPIGPPRRRDTVDQDLGAVDNFGKEPIAYDWFGEIDQADGKEEKEDGNMVAKIKAHKPATPYFQEFLGKDGEFRKDIDDYLLLPPLNVQTHNPEDVGNSDEELSDSDIEEDGSPVIAKFRFDPPIKAKEVTITCSDGVIKGDEFLFLTHRLVQIQILKNKKKYTCYNLHQMGHPSRCHVQGGYRWLSTAGHWACSMAESEIEGSKEKKQNKIYLEEVLVGFSKTNVLVKYDGSSERLWFSDRLGGAQEDFSCTRIYEITQELRQEHGLTEEMLAFFQLELLVGRLHEQTPPEIVYWLDGVNAWLFGVEASRVNTTFVTGVMVLELIQAGKMTYKEALAEGDFGGQMPLAAVGSKKGNFTARKRLLDHVEKEKPAGLSIDRQNPQWLAVTLKEAMVIKNWLKFKGGINRKMPMEDANKGITQAISNLISYYYSSPDKDIIELNDEHFNAYMSAAEWADEVHRAR